MKDYEKALMQQCQVCRTELLALKEALDVYEDTVGKTIITDNSYDMISMVHTLCGKMYRRVEKDSGENDGNDSGIPYFPLR